MSAKSILLFESYRAAQGRPVVRRVGLREAARKLRHQAAEMLADAAELEEAADAAGEPKE